MPIYSEKRKRAPVCAAIILAKSRASPYLCIINPAHQTDENRKEKDRTQDYPYFQHRQARRHDAGSVADPPAKVCC